METKHTPGPWQFDPHEDGDYFWISPVASGGYGWVGDRYLRVNGHMNIADARLIAAAPDLLAALMRCKFDSLNMSTEDLEFCRAAFIKATGSAA